jgi:hypothetical protein
MLGDARPKAEANVSNYNIIEDRLEKVGFFIYIFSISGVPIPKGPDY